MIKDLDQGFSFHGKRSNGIIESGNGSAEVAAMRKTTPFDCAVAKLGAEKVLFEDFSAETSAVIVTVSAPGPTSCFVMRRWKSRL